MRRGSSQFISLFSHEFYGPLAAPRLDFHRHVCDDFWLVSLALLFGLGLGSRFDVSAPIAYARETQALDKTKEELRSRLAAFGQEHVLAFWDQLALPMRQRLGGHIMNLDLAQIDALFHGATAPEDWADLARRATSPPAVRLHDFQRSFSMVQAHERGQQVLESGQVGVILVAGGQGTRLGLDHPKGMFSIGPVSGASLFQILLEKIVARSRSCGMRIPLYLMTSPATYDETIEYMRANENFGLPRDELTIFCQGTMPAIDAQTGRLLLAEKDQLALSPDGHGGMLQALAANGCLSDIHQRGLRHLFYCQIDNPLVEMCDPTFLGYHVLSNSELSTQVVAKRTPRDNVGNVVSIDGKLRIIEYSDLNPLADEIVERRAVDGTPVFWAGNTAIHVFEVTFLQRMAHSGSALPFHVAKKAVSCLDRSGERLEPREPNAIKFERFIFDLLPAASQAIVVEVDESQSFAPVKNASGDPRDTPESVQEQMIALHTAWLRAAGCEVAPGTAVEISPLFAQNAQEVAEKVSPGLLVTQPRFFC
jgi:UDP-N-acetylglucosamine/UDP-N-acetylgalactosamine diphosphorylase